MVNFADFADLRFLTTSLIERKRKRAISLSLSGLNMNRRIMQILLTTFSQDSRLVTTKLFISYHWAFFKEVESNIEENDRQRADDVDRVDKDLQVLQNNLRDSEEKITHTIEESKSSLLENTSLSCQSVRDYCKENIIDVNNNLVDFKVNMNNIT